MHVQAHVNMKTTCIALSSNKIIMIKQFQFALNLTNLVREINYVWNIKRTLYRYIMYITFIIVYYV